MTMFWIMAALATSFAALLVFGAARRGADRLTRPEGEAAANARRELAGLDQLKSAGQMTEEVWQQARAEAGRRWLNTPASSTFITAGPQDRRLVVGGVVMAVLTTLGLYLLMAEPGYPDQAYAARVETWATSTETLEPAQVAAVLDREVRATPDDRRLLTLLGAARFQAGDSIGAASALRRALALDPDDGQTWARLGESLVRAADGEIGADAEAAFREALKHDPDQLGARFFLGDLAFKRGDLDGARLLWTPLMAALDPADPRRLDLERRLAMGVAG